MTIIVNSYGTFTRAIMVVAERHSFRTIAFLKIISLFCIYKAYRMHFSAFQTLNTLLDTKFESPGFNAFVTVRLENRIKDKWGRVIIYLQLVEGFSCFSGSKRCEPDKW